MPLHILIIHIIHINLLLILRNVYSLFEHR